MQRKIQIHVIYAKPQECKVLVLKTNPQAGGHWAPVTGGVEQEELLKHAAIRELFEETGIKTDHVTDLGIKFNFHSRWGNDVEESCFFYLVPEIPEIKISEEHTEFAWRSPEELSEDFFKYPNHWQTLQKALVIINETP